MNDHFDPRPWTDGRAGRYFVCDDQLRISPEDPGADAPPTGWEGAVQAQEEVMETLVVLNLEKLLADDVQFLFRAGDYWGIQDITAIDPLGMIHLLELKKGTIGAKVTEQLAAYLMRTMFDDASAFANRLADHNERHLGESRWAVYLAGALANERTTTVGPAAYRSTVSEKGLGPALSDNTWKKQTEFERQDRQISAWRRRRTSSGRTA